MRSAVYVKGRIGPSRGVGARRKRPRAICNVVVEQTVASADCHLSISKNVIPKTNTWAYTHWRVVDNVGVVPTAKGHHAVRHLVGKISPRSRSEEGERGSRIVVSAPVPKVIVSKPDIQSELLVHFPIVLDDPADVQPPQH